MCVIVGLFCLLPGFSLVSCLWFDLLAFGLCWICCVLLFAFLVRFVLLCNYV